MIQRTQSAQILQKQDICNIYVIIKTMCPPGYHHDSFVVTQMYELQQSPVAIITDRAHCFRDYIYIYI